RKFGYLASEFVVSIDHAALRRWRARAVEQQLLGIRIVLHVAMEIEMVASEVGENGNLERNAPYPALLEGVRGDFHDRVPRPPGTKLFVSRLGKHRIQLQRFWCSVGRR